MAALQDDDAHDSSRRESVPLFDIPNIGRVSGLGSTWERSRQTLALYLCSLYFAMPMILVSWYWTAILFLFPLTTLHISVYLGYIFKLDQSPETGTYTAWIRQWKIWEYACDYFPLLIVKTSELKPDGRYVLGYHPHGIISCGAMGAFATNGARTLDLSKGDSSHTASSSLTTEDYGDSPRGFSSLFPGIDQRLVTLPINFSTPFLREYILGMGCCNSSKETFRNVLQRNKGQGNALVVVVGGAAESMLVKPGSIELVLENRRGFIREAIISNASLVPVLAFGETDLYHIIEGHEANGFIRDIQDWVREKTGVAMPLFRGRSLFFRDFGLMPLRKTLIVVVGKPIPPPQLPGNTIFNPLVNRNTREPQNEHGKILLEWHDKYCNALKDMFQTYKDKDWNTSGRSRRESLKIVK